MGGVPMLYQPQTMMDALGQGNALRQQFVQSYYQPQQIQNQLALQQNQNALQKNQIALGNYDVQNAPTAIANQNALAQLQLATGNANLQYGSGPLGQLFRAANNPDLTPEQKSAANNAIFWQSSLPQGTPNNPLTQAAFASFLQNNPEVASNIQKATGMSPGDIVKMIANQYQSTTTKNNAQAQQDIQQANIGIPAKATEAIASANQKNTQTVNAGGVSTGLKSDLKSVQDGLDSASIAQQQATAGYPQQSFTLWNPQDQDKYISENNAPPPLSGSAITKQIDAKTVARINGLAPAAQSIQFMQEGLNDPVITQYMGNSAQARTQRATAQAAALIGRPPDSYSKYLSFEKQAQALIADTFATTQTGSRSFGMMQQFQKVFDPGSQTSLNQAKESINNAGKILYDEGKTYVGAPYEPGVRNSAFNGVKLLNNMGFGSQKSNQSSARPPSGMSKDEFIKWQRSQGGGS